MSHSAKILITDDVHPLLKEGLERDGFIVDERPNISREEVLQIASTYHGIVINSRIVADKELLDKATDLKFVCRAGSGLEVIDLEFAKARNIIAFNSPEGNRNAVAEHALGMLLNIMNNISRSYVQVKNKEWIREANRGSELRGKTIGLIAYGNTAQSLAKLLIGFNVTILAYDKYYHGFTNDFVHESSLDVIFDKCDVVSIHLPLTAETNNMIDYKFLSSFRRPIWLINTSRGKVLKTSDLIKCIEERRVLSAALDVLENENLNALNKEQEECFNQLIQDNRILITPHIAGWTHESKRKIAEVLLSKIRSIS